MVQGRRDSSAGKIEAIASDRVHGAAYLTARAAEALLGSADVKTAARALIDAQPAMASIRALAERVLRNPDKAGVICREVLRQGRIRLAAAAARAAQLLPDGGVAMTHSFSATVEESFYAAQRAGKTFRVIATESRPMREGIALARCLAEREIDVRLIADSAVFRFMAGVDVALVGADAVTPSHVVNKIGTACVALAAREHSIPVYAVCTSDKRTNGAPPAERPHAAEELLPERYAGIAVSNYYFESVPRSLFAGIITEEPAA
jgi:translation initiation factor 2B subunit (eIF-2B alpha/beta/delta family)